jgi:hypothetical protein
VKKPLVVVALSIVAVFVLMADACSGSSSSTPQENAQAAAANKAANHVIYVPHNDVELQNYNARQKLADDPTTLLWCTSAFPIPGSPMFTVPVLGKLTSANKRPTPTSQVQSYYQSGGSYSPDLPGPDGFYGSSSDYRYGFTPGGVYVDFYNLQTFCTTEPTVFQRQSTKIVMQVDANLAAAQLQAQAALRAGNAAQAQQILQQALGQ